MEQGQFVQLEIPSSPEFVSLVRHAVENVAKRMHFEPSQISDLALAVGEACTNAVKYGSPVDDAHNVEVKCVARPNGLLIEIRNFINGQKMPQIPEKPDLNQDHGFGLYIIKQLVDEVDIHKERKKMVVRMLKRLPANSSKIAS